MNAIRPWLYIGKYRETLDKDLLSTKKIDAMLQLAEAVKHPDITSIYLTVEDGVRRFNASYLFDRNGDLTGIYRKQELVPFGEYFPFGNLFKGLQRELEEESGALFFDRGGNSDPLTITGPDGHAYHFGVLICFESTLGALSRDYANTGADFLVNITNDYWSGSRKAMYQHLVFSIFRAVENRMPIFRAGNGGVSCFINPKGHVFTRIPVGVPGVMSSSVPIDTDRQETFYTRHGDWFAWLCAAIAAVSFGWIIAKPRLKQRAREKHRGTKLPS